MILVLFASQDFFFYRKYVDSRRLQEMHLAEIYRDYFKDLFTQFRINFAADLTDPVDDYDGLNRVIFILFCVLNVIVFLNTLIALLG